MNLPVFSEGLLLFVLTCFLVVAIGGFALFFKKVFDAEEKFEEKEKKTIHDYKSVLLHAHKDAERILTEASAKGTQLEQEIVETNKKIVDHADATVAKTVQDLLDQYQKNLAMLHATIEQQTQDMFTTIAKTTQDDMKTYLGEFSNKTTSIQETLMKQADESFKKMQEELQAYKKEQMDKISQEVSGVVHKVSLDFLGRAISTVDHEKLLLVSLEKAKKEDILLRDTI